LVILHPQPVNNLFLRGETRFYQFQLLWVCEGVLALNYFL
jgi:hypothetical protein